MAILLITPPSPRDVATASVQRASSRVYSPFPNRRLVRPMAVPAQPTVAKPRRGLFRRSA